MKTYIAAMLAGSSLLAAPSAAQAQSADAGLELSDIVVTARRATENLQDIPVTVNAVSAAVVQDLNLTRFEEISTVVPGLNLSNGVTGYSSFASVRGVSFDTSSSAAPTVQFYVNDSPFETSRIFNSLFDVGQIEVLRGPQGTTRGVSSPSGAITMTTRRPDTAEFGGAITTSMTDQNGVNFQTALNVPIIEDMLAVRISGLFDENEGDGVRSLNSAQAPLIQTEAYRISVQFTPMEDITANIMWQNLTRDVYSYQQLAGSGNATGARPANWTGPAIGAFDLLAVSDDYANEADQEDQMFTANVQWNLGRVRLEYIGGWTSSDTKTIGDGDVVDFAHDRAVYTINNIPADVLTHEIRIASNNLGGFFDYVAGVFYSRSDSIAVVRQPQAVVFGGGPTYSTLADSYGADINRVRHVEETSIFASGTFHLGDATDLTIGVRAIETVTDNLTLGVTSAPLIEAEEEEPAVWNVALSHEFTDDVMVYGTVGASYRRGPVAVGLFNGANDPELAQFLNLDSEESQSIELGFKSMFLNNRARLNVAIWQQEFDNLIIRNRNIPYFRFINAFAPLDSNRATIFNFTYSADALVQGIDIDAAFQIADTWDVSLAASYADGYVDHDAYPCNDGDADGVEDSFASTWPADNAGGAPTGDYVRICNGSPATSAAPLWSAVLQSEYVHPLSGDAEAFLRGLFSYTPKNERAARNYTAPAYGLLSLFAGVRSADGVWEVAVFGKNILDTEKVTFQDDYFLESTGVNPLAVGNSGYRAVTTTPEQTFGLALRYAWGSR